MLKTTSQILSHHHSLEETQADYHEELAQKHSQHSQLFKRLARDNHRSSEMAQRAYREGVTDAFEVGFLADPLDTDKYRLEKPIGNLTESIEAMKRNEEKIIEFCLDAAQNSSQLLPDLPETFERLVKRKKKNIEKMEQIA